MKKFAALALTVLLGSTLVAIMPADAHSTTYPSWGHAHIISRNLAAGDIHLTVDDHYVDAHWTTSQSNVDACTYVKIRSKSSGVWYSSSSWKDCGGIPEKININQAWAIDRVRIESKDNRGRWRYYTVAYG